MDKQESADRAARELDEVTRRVNERLGREHDLHDSMKLHFRAFVQRRGDLSAAVTASAFLSDLERAWKRADHQQHGDPQAFAALARELMSQCEDSSVLRLGLAFAQRGRSDFRSAVGQGAAEAVAGLVARPPLPAAESPTLGEACAQLRFPGIDG